jgi:hypothetical protein
LGGSSRSARNVPNASSPPGDPSPVDLRTRVEHNSTGLGFGAGVDGLSTMFVSTMWRGCARTVA